MACSTAESMHVRSRAPWIIKQARKQAGKQAGECEGVRVRGSGVWAGCDSSVRNNSVMSEWPSDGQVTALRTFRQSRHDNPHHKHLRQLGANDARLTMRLRTPPIPETGKLTLYHTCCSRTEKPTWAFFDRLLDAPRPPPLTLTLFFGFSELTRLLQLLTHL